ncbi:recombinase family protein [Microvirga tunisiensis]|uniref:Recombinase family protein n=1 Tax=Pannonibacter tanglangensis TaxID=2750084 RepID=A0A7X5F1Y9_9HYPH|nr:recombinase family protein [Pannonibacter sp. XCT-53]NBN77305.1 recombinase family protein [Pannonibacter sp. XCT-53]
MLVRAYLRASTKEQDATRARAALDAFAKERGLKIAARYIENESGASLDRPELFRLLADCEPGDILLIEQVDRLSRLSGDDWNRLKAEISARGVKVVALDLPTSWTLASATATDEFSSRMAEAINGMMLDMLAAIARKDYADRRRRQAEGIAKAKADGRYTGRPANEARNAAIARMLERGDSWSMIMAATGAAKGTIAKLAKKMKEDASA